MTELKPQSVAPKPNRRAWRLIAGIKFVRRPWTRRSENPCRDRSLRVLGEVHRPTAPRRRAGRRHAHQRPFPSQPVRRPDQGVPLSVRPAGLVGRAPARGYGPLQHLLGAVQSPALQARRCGPQHAGALRGRQEGRRPADRPRQHHQSRPQDSPLEYFRGKAILEKALVESGISHAILRPAVLFGKEDILINNIAWALRRLPVFGLFGDGRYRLQPIYVDDLAALAVEQGKARENVLINALGPETFTYRDLVKSIGQRIGKTRPIVSVPPWFGYVASRLLGVLVGDVIITRDEIEGLMGDLLYVDAPPTGRTVLTEWITSHADTLGRSYTSELARRKDRRSAYQSN